MNVRKMVASVLSLPAVCLGLTDVATAQDYAIEGHLDCGTYGYGCFSPIGLDSSGNAYGLAVIFMPPHDPLVWGAGTSNAVSLTLPSAFLTGSLADVQTGSPSASGRLVVSGTVAAQNGFQNDIFSYSSPTSAPVFVAAGQGAAINDAGQIAGYDSTHAPTLWNSGIATTLDVPGGVLGGNYNITGISNHGAVVGNYGAGGVSPSNSQAVLWNGAAATFLPTPGGAASSYATAINNGGQIVGYSTNSTGTTAATIWNGNSSGQLLAPGAVSSKAVAINNLGQVVGNIGLAPGSTVATHAALWQSAGTGAIDLNSFLNAQNNPNGYVLTDALAINDKGGILAAGFNGDPITGAGYFLIEPIPEPGICAMMLAGLGVVAGCARRRRDGGRSPALLGPLGRS